MALCGLWLQCCKGDTISACTYSLSSLGAPIPYQAALAVPWVMPGHSGWIQTYFCVQSLGEIVWFTKDRAVALHSKKTWFFLFSRINLLAKCKPLCSHYCSTCWLSLTSQLHKEVGLLFWNYKSECLFDVRLCCQTYFKYHSCYFLATTSWSKSNSCFKMQTKLQLQLHGSFLE